MDQQAKYDRLVEQVESMAVEKIQMEERLDGYEGTIRTLNGELAEQVARTEGMEQAYKAMIHDLGILLLDTRSG